MSNELEGLRCPACNSPCRLSFTIADKERTDWVFCSCGSIFHQKEIDLSYYNKEWLDVYLKWKSIKERYEYIERVYFNLVGELTYGRKFLDVGFGADYHINNLRENGWIATGIDIIKNDHLNGNFEEYDFKDKTFDFIFMGNVLGGFKDPIKSIYKAKELLNDNGLIMIMDADAELVYQRGMWNFGNWNAKERWLIFSERQIKKVLETFGFKVIVSHKNTEERFMNWNTFNLIAQKT